MKVLTDIERNQLQAEALQAIQGMYKGIKKVFVCNDYSLLIYSTQKSKKNLISIAKDHVRTGAFEFAGYTDCTDNPFCDHNYMQLKLKAK